MHINIGRVTLPLLVAGTLIAPAAVLGTAPAAAASTPTKIPTKYSSCTAVKKVASGGIARTAKDSRRVKGKQKVNSKVYWKYEKWDRNDDGVICGPGEKKSARKDTGHNESYYWEDRCPTGSEVVGVRNIHVPAGWFIVEQGKHYNGWEVVIQNMLTGDEKDAVFTLICHWD